MARVRLSVDVDPELRRRIKISAAARDETVKDFLERAIMRELREGNGGTARSYDEDEWDDGELYIPPKDVKPKGSENPPKLERGNTLSEAVIEDRR